MPPNHGFVTITKRLFPLGPHILGGNPEKMINMATFYSRRDLLLENLALRQQLMALKRRDAT